MSNDKYYMSRVLELALKAKGKTSPNPLVGAVVVKNNKIVGSGYHKKAGMPHAEVIALREAGLKAKNATLYVNLEPCSHYGRTPPCTDKIINSGIKKVVVGMIDPNPKNFGRGLNILRKAKIKVETGVLKKEAININKPFMKYITAGLPYITVKVGQSLDGKIATKTYDSKWITSESSRIYARKLRDDFDAVMLGINTVLNDNPALDTKKAVRIIVDTDLKITPGLNLFKNRKTKIIIGTTKNKINKKFPDNVEIITVKQASNKIDLIDLMKKLANLEIANVFVEGGGELIGSLFDARLVDEIKFFIAPKIVGGREAISSVMGSGVKKMSEAIKLENIKLTKIGSDLLIEGICSAKNLGG